MESHNYVILEGGDPRAMNGTQIKIKMLKRGVRQRDLIQVLNDKYGMNTNPTEMSLTINGQLNTPKAQKIRDLVWKELEA